MAQNPGTTGAPWDLPFPGEVSVADVAADFENLAVKVAEGLGLLAGQITTLATTASVTAVQNTVTAVQNSLNALTTRVTATERRAAGRATVKITNAVSGSVVVTFPAGRFSAAPYVVASAQVGGGSGGAAKVMARVGSATATTVTIYAYVTDDSVGNISQDILVQWIAVQA